MDLRWTLLCVLACAGGALADNMNISSIVGDRSRAAAYLDWDMGIVLTTPYAYMGNDNFGAATATTWQQFYQHKSVYQAYELAGRSSAGPGNATLAIEVTGSIGKWQYTSNTSCATVMTKPCNSFSDEGLAGTGLVPITCGLADPAQPAANGNVLCNALYKRSSVQLFPAGMMQPLQTLDSTAADASFGVGSFMTPMSHGDLLLSEGDQFEWAELDSRSFISISPSVEYMTNKHVKTSLSAFKGLGRAAQCTGSQLPLILPLQGMLLGGTMFYCFDVQGDVVVMTWDLFRFQTATSCGRIRDKRRFMLVLYGGSELQTDQIPFQNVYTVEEAADGKWEVTCTTRCYQSTDPSSKLNENWDRLYSFGSDGLQTLWPNITKCANGTWGPTKPDHAKGLVYRAKVSKGLARGNDDGVLYPHFSAQSMGPLQGGVNASHMLKLTPSNESSLCVLNQVTAPPEVLGAGSASMATASITSLLALGVGSGYGAQNLPVIRQQISDMSAQFSSLTVSVAVTAAMTSIVAAYGANVFTLKVKFLKATNVTRLSIRTLVSVVEAVVASVAAITAMWALYSNGQTCRTMQWVDTQTGTTCEYEKCNHYISTSATICGSADYLVEQWVVLGMGLLLATVLIMYRWHFARGGSVSDWVEIETEQENAAQNGIDKV